MKLKLRSKILLPGAALLGSILFAGTTTSFAQILQTVSQGTGASWNQASWGPTPDVPLPGNNYETPSTFAVRTPNVNLSGLYSTNFAGDSLKIDSGGVLYLKHGGNATNAAIVNLILNGGR